MEKLHLSLTELITVSAIITSVTTAYVIMHEDVKSLKEDLVVLRLHISRLEEEQATIKVRIQTFGIPEQKIRKVYKWPQ